MNRTYLKFALLLTALILPALSIAQPAPAPMPMPMPAPAPMPKFALPPLLPEVPATVGDVKIDGKKINTAVAKEYKNMLASISQQFARIPAQSHGAAKKYFQGQIDKMPYSYLKGEVFLKLQSQYIKRNKITCTDKEYADFVATIKTRLPQGMTLETALKEQGMSLADFRDFVAWETYAKVQLSPEKAKAFIKANPTYFDGTKRSSSHILIACDALAATTIQKAIIAQLAKIGADIEAKKTTFGAEAAKYSVCPSGVTAKGSLGDIVCLGAQNRMVPTFSYGTFQCKLGGVITPIRTNFGFHLIQAGKEIPAPTAAAPDKAQAAAAEQTNIQSAQQLLGTLLQNKIFDQALGSCPIAYAPTVQAKMDKDAAEKQKQADQMRTMAKARAAAEAKAKAIEAIAEAEAKAVKDAEAKKLVETLKKAEAKDATKAAPEAAAKAAEAPAKK
ncbi:MAG: hypothetical protein HN909_02400 [Phycisphaerales bacterium]|jgi:parvulin-like peptidyl-prolyl isomerase|nr:hypothetical protein [Phycisphaerales bacterium]MBT7170601.1 hypothetical protein [Phycisphaerales bacterium]